MVLPAGFALPPLPYLVAVLAAATGVGYWLYRAGAPVTDRTVLAFSPWIAVGSACYVCFQVGAWPASVAPFFGSPVVYLTTFAVAGAVWAFARQTSDEFRVLAGAGLLALSGPVALALQYGTSHGTLTLAWPLASVAAAVVLAAVTWRALQAVRPAVTETTRWVGALAVFGHALDGTSTAVGVDVLGFGEQTPLSAAVMHAAGALQRALLGGVPLGVGWLFVLVKLVLAAVVVTLLADVVREEPTQGRLLLAGVAAVGLGPGVHNVLLFVVATPAGF